MIAALVYGISTRLIDQVYRNAELRASGAIREYIHRETLIDKLRKRAAQSNPIIASVCMIAAALAACVLSMGIRISSLQTQLEKAQALAHGGIKMYVSETDYSVVTPEPTTETVPETTTTAETTTTTTTTTTKTIATTTKELAAPVQQAASEDNGIRVYDVSMDICKFISQYEGNYALYQCESDCWTVGYGHAFTSKESRSWSREKAMSMMNRDIEKVLGKEYCLTTKNQKLSDEAAMKLLQWDLTNGYKPQLDRFIKKNGIKMNQQQYDACISFAYNCGANVWNVKRFKFRDTLVSYKDCSKIPAHIARDQLDNWNHGAHGVLKGLTRRRRNEARLFSTGSYKIINSPDDYCV